MKKLKLSKYLDISTAHITEKDGALIGKKQAPFYLMESEGGTGCFFYVPGLDTADDVELTHELSSFGFSLGFVRLFLQARESKARLIRFDVDGDDHDLPTYDW
jgi:hypothetical protein